MAYVNLGNVLRDQGELGEAAACYRQAIERQPDFTEAHNNLGTALKDQGRLDEAVASYQRALQLAPSDAAVLSNLGNALGSRGELGEAVATYRRALELKPDYAPGHSNLLFTLQYRPGVSLADLASAHATVRAGARPAAPSRMAPALKRPRRRSPPSLGLRLARFGTASRGQFHDSGPGEPRPGTMRNRVLLRPARPRRTHHPSSRRRGARGATSSDRPTGNWPSRFGRIGSTSSSIWPATPPATASWRSPASRRRSKSPGSGTSGPPGSRRWTISWPITMRFHPHSRRTIASGSCGCRTAMSATSRPTTPRRCALAGGGESVRHLRRFPQSGQNHSRGGQSLGPDPPSRAAGPRAVDVPGDGRSFRGRPAGGPVRRPGD